MKMDHKGHVIKLAKFLGYELTENQADLIVENSSFSARVQKFGGQTFPGWRSDRSPFLRKGETGDWKNYFSQDQCDYVDEMSRKYLEPLGITFT